jgi:hypothetical protein
MSMAAAGFFPPETLVITCDTASCFDPEGRSVDGHLCDTRKTRRLQCWQYVLNEGGTCVTLLYDFGFYSIWTAAFESLY